MTTATYIQTEAEFDALLTDAAVVVVDCTASWCGPCKLVAPLMDQLAAAYEGQVKVFKLDLDENRPVAKRLGIRSIPAVMFFKNGELLETLVGVKPYETFTETVDKYLQA
jgi:thioredoxin 1